MGLSAKIMGGDRHNWWGQTLLVGTDINGGTDIIGGDRHNWLGQTNIASF